ncbi:MAG: AraC family ligand binding domain-containing protein [Bacteroidia bacterium]
MRNPASTFSYYEDSRDPSGTQSSDNQIIYSRLRKVDRKVVNKGISIKYVIEGEESYRVNHQSYKVKSGEYLIINEGREVQCSLESDHPVEGLWIHLSKDLIEEVYREIKSSLPDSKGIRLLDPAGKLELCEHVFTAQDSFLGKQLEALGESTRQHPHQPVREVNQVARNLAEGLVRSQWRVYQQINRLTSAKLSTKKELYRRLCIAGLISTII